MSRLVWRGRGKAEAELGCSVVGDVGRGNGMSGRGRPWAFKLGGDWENAAGLNVDSSPEEVGRSEAVQERLGGCLACGTPARIRAVSERQRQLVHASVELETVASCEGCTPHGTVLSC